jgi:hypothetical protein
LADGVEDPKKFEAAGLKSLGGFEDGFEVALRALAAEKHDADGEGNFGIDDLLREKLFAKILHDEGIIAGMAKKRSDPLEGVEEAEKVRVGVAATNFFFGVVHAMTRRELRDDQVTDAALKVKVELSLGKRKNGLGERAVERVGR